MMIDDVTRLCKDFNFQFGQVHSITLSAFQLNNDKYLYLVRQFNGSCVYARTDVSKELCANHAAVNIYQQ